MQNNANNGLAAYRNNGAEIMQLNDIAGILDREYKKKIINFFDGKENKALMFLSGILADIQRNPKLKECDQQTLFNAYMMMAQLKLMPSGVSGEAYVLPYNDKRRGMIAQFQLGYQGLVTLFYRAGALKIHSDIVRKNDKFSYVNGEVKHEPDIFGDERGEAIGAYVIIDLQSGGQVAKVMSKKEIMTIGEKFSKSFRGDFSPWKASQDPELWMWKKTVLKQAAKLVPKNESINMAIAEDNKDSVIEDKKDRFGGVELPDPRALKVEPAKTEKAVAAVNEMMDEVKESAEKMEKEAEVTYEATNTGLFCTVCGQEMTSGDVDFCDNKEMPHTCADCRRKQEKTPASSVIAQRNSLRENGNGKEN